MELGMMLLVLFNWSHSLRYETYVPLNDYCPTLQGCNKEVRWKRGYHGVILQSLSRCFVVVNF